MKNQHKLQSTLRTLKNFEPIRVVFVISEDGGLVAWAGRSEAFSPVGQFSPFDPNSQRDENLYLSVLGQHYLGILFLEGTAFEDIQAHVDEFTPDLKAHLGYDA